MQLTDTKSTPLRETRPAQAVLLQMAVAYAKSPTTSIRTVFMVMADLIMISRR